ncbi:MAG: hypothetical protein J6S67_12995 [Methanobrevibacter sp.]|nr:hypothetical protein [Methanobrevibacter sp.]
MKNWINEILSTIGIVLGVDISTTKDVFGLILVILNILVLIISLILKIISWYQKAKEDGKIDKEEIKEGIDIIVDGVKQIEESLPKDKEEEKDESQGKN